MKKLIISLLMSLLVVSAMATPITTITWANNHSPLGGEFTLTQAGVPTFNTFCLERNQYINVGDSYFYTIANATDGGINGSPDPISIGTAWLYSNFRNGTLSGFTGNSIQQNQLQNTFWYLEGEVNTTSDTGGWLSLAQSALPNANLFSDANGAYGVNVWNLFDDRGTPCQSQLGMSVPDGGSTLLMGFMGFFAIIGIRKFTA